MKRIVIILAALAAAFSCTNEKRQPALLDPAAFADTLEGKPVALYTLKNADLVLQVTNYGARVASIWTPDRKGNYDNVVVGRASLEGYVHPAGERFLGACVGPVANRIGNAEFAIGDMVFKTPANEAGITTLHGGYKGLDNVVWDVKSVDESSIVLTYLHEDGQEGFPGNLSIEMRYELTPSDEFRITYSAVTDSPTPVNITNHPFFNLSGEGSGSIEDCVMTINASSYIPIDAHSIPLGGTASVEGTPFDFREPHAIGERLGEDNEQLRNARGYDHNWCLDRKGEGMEQACTVYDPASGRFLEVLTDQIGLQFYSGNFFDGNDVGSNGKPLIFRSSFALETQYFPDSPNHPEYPSILLNPGETYTHECIYRFSTRK
ncbi:MAG: galactose mutarotase [Bacteroidales bacterium]|nr:galactose mutarotase [Bacteroidales bacterium]